MVEAIIDGVAAGSRDFGIKTNLIGIMSRTFGTEQCKRELDACLAHRDRLVAIDLAGDELGFPGELFTDHFRRVQDAGMRVTVHAGEAAGPEHVAGHSRAGSQRIGHGVKAIQDPAPMAYLAEHRIGIESCLTSNLQTTTRWRVWPITRSASSWRPACWPASIPTIRRWRIDLPHEYEVAAPLPA